MMLMYPIELASYLHFNQYIEEVDYRLVEKVPE